MIFIDCNPVNNEADVPLVQVRLGEDALENLYDRFCLAVCLDQFVSCIYTAAHLGFQAGDALGRPRGIRQGDSAGRQGQLRRPV